MSYCEDKAEQAGKENFQDRSYAIKIWTAGGSQCISVNKQWLARA